MIGFRLNGRQVTVDVKPNELLLDVLRLKLDIKSPKRGCEEGECGACTILLNGKPVYSCLILAPQVEGAEIETLEGLAENKETRLLASSFAEHGGVQCGYCTPGFMVTSYALIKKKGKIAKEDVVKGLEGNLCRCTGYKKIIEAIMDAANKMITG